MNVALLRPLPLRIASAVLILVVALAGGVAIWGHQVLGAEHSCPMEIGPFKPGAQYDCYFHPRPDWVYPAASAVVFLGLAGATGVLVRVRRREA